MFEQHLGQLHIVDGAERGLLWVEEALARCEWQVAPEKNGGVCLSCSSPNIKSEVLSLMLFNCKAELEVHQFSPIRTRNI
jgi:hypothetical protein